MEVSHYSISLFLENAVFDGKGVSFYPATLGVPRFEGIRSVGDINCFPFEYAIPTIGKLLEERGRRYIDRCLKGRHHVYNTKEGQGSVSTPLQTDPRPIGGILERK